MNNSFCVHLDQVLDFPLGTRRGMWGPLKGPFVRCAKAKMTQAAKVANEAVIVQLATRPCASFLCAVEDVPRPTPECRRLWIHLASDAAFRIEPPRVPHIFGAAPGVCWRWPLTGEWSRRHVTLTEACGRALNEIVLAPMYPEYELLFEGDNTMALSVGQGTERSVDAQYVAWRKQQVPTYRDVVARSWDTHTSGYMNDLVDVGSRDRQDVLDIICAAFGYKMLEVDLESNEVARSFMADVLANTCPYDPPVDSRAGRTDRAAKHFNQGRKVSAGPHVKELPKHEYGGEAAEVIQYLPLHDATPPRGERLLARSAASSAASLPLPPSSPGPSQRQVVPARPSSSRQDASSPDPQTPEALDSGRRAMMATRRSPRAGEPSEAQPEPLDTGKLPMQQSQTAGLRSVENSPEAMISRGSASKAEALRGQRSPTPVSAHAARQRAAAEVARSLVEDQSPYALFPDDADMLRAAVEDTHTAIAKGRPLGTTRRDDWGFNWVSKFCTATGNSVMRPKSPPPEEHQREAYFAAFAIMWMAVFMLPSARRRARGFSEAMPSSSLQALYGWRAVQTECNRWLPDMALVAKALKGLNEEYKQRWGQDALVPERTEPIPLWALRSMVTVLMACTVLDPAISSCYLVMLCFGIVAAPRLDELCEMFDGDTFFVRGNFVWFDGDAEVTPTRVNLAALKNGALLRARSAPSKADRTNTEWGGRDMWFRVDSSNHLGFAHRFLQWEIDNFCPCSLRSTWPAFSLSGADVPLKPEPVRAWHKKLVTHVMGPERAKLRTWHALRATLASAIAAYRGSDNKPLENYEGVAQMMVRWKSLDSLRLYLKVKASDYADYADIVTSTDGSAVSQEDLPPLGPEGAIADVEAAVASLHGKRNTPSQQVRGEPSTLQRLRAPAGPTGPKPQLLSTRVRVKWDNEWYYGVCGTSRADGGAWVTRVAYAACEGHSKCSLWHNLSIETWEQVE